MKVEKIFSKNIIKIRNDSTIIEAAALLFKNQISGLLVVDAKDNLVGILSEKDLYRALYPDYKDFYSHPEACLDFEEMESKASNIRDWPVEKIMTSNTYTISDQDPLMKVGAIMLAKNVNRLPVVNNEGKLLGIVSRRDIYQAIFKKEFQKDIA